LSYQIFVPLMEQSPARGCGGEKNARGEGKQAPHTATLISLPELSEISVAGAAGAKVVEPLLGLRERQLLGGDSLENRKSWAAGTAGIRKLFKQTPA
jgi:hypothetical protein